MAVCVEAGEWHVGGRLLLLQRGVSSITARRVIAAAECVPVSLTGRFTPFAPAAFHAVTTAWR